MSQRVGEPTGFDFFERVFPKHLHLLNPIFSLSEKQIEKIIRKFKKDVPNYQHIREEKLITYFTNKAEFDKPEIPLSAIGWNPTEEDKFGEFGDVPENHSPNRSANASRKRSPNRSRRSPKRSRRSPNIGPLNTKNEENFEPLFDFKNDRK